MLAMSTPLNGAPDGPLTRYSWRDSIRSKPQQTVDDALSLLLCPMRFGSILGTSPGISA